MLNQSMVSNRMLGFVVFTAKQFLRVMIISLFTLSVSAMAGEVNLTLVDAKSQNALPNVSVTAYKLDTSGKRNWYKRLSTDENGVALFSLDNVENGQAYVFGVKHYNEHSSYSEPIASASSFRFAIGALQISLKDGNRSGTPALVNHPVSIRLINSDGSTSYYSSAVSDSAGQLRLDLPGLGESSRYELQAKTSITQDKKVSVPFSQNGNYDFVVGSLPVTVMLKNHKTSGAIANQSVAIYERLPDGKTQWRASKTTDSDGVSYFDLDGVDSGRVYYAKAKVYNNSNAYSPDITKSGEHPFIVGNTRVLVTDGSKAGNVPLVEQRVDIYRVKPEGGTQYFNTAYTDNEGRLYLTLNDISAQAQYVLKAKSTVAEQYKYSTPLASTGEHQFKVGNLPLIAILTDGISGSAIINQRVDAYQVQADGSQKWYANANTNDVGEVSFDLEGLGAGTTYQLKTKYFNDASTYSKKITTPGDYAFAIGTTHLTVYDGSSSDKTLLSSHSIYLYHLLTDGSKKSLGKFTTDSAGVLRLNLNDVSTSNAYIFRAKSVNDTWYEQAITQQGKQSFIVGSLPVSLTLRDGLHKTPLANQSVTVYRLTADGKREYYSRIETDQSGKANIDIANLSAANPYQLATKVFSNFTALSEPIIGSGDLTFDVGNVNLQLVNGSDGGQSSLADTSVTIYKIIEGKRTWYSRALSDNSGLVRVDLPSFDVGQTYQFGVKSTVDGSTKYSAIVAANGQYDFVVGNPAVNVRLTNFLSGQVYADTQVTAYRITEENKHQWYSNQTTDANGMASFDLDNIGDGGQYIFKTKLFSTGYSQSEAVSSPGSIEFQVGMLPVSLKNAETGTSIANAKITVYEIDMQNKLQWRSSGNTDSSGAITFDVPGLTLGQRFVLKANNPFGESKNYYGPVISQPGAVQFLVEKGKGQSLDLESPMVAVQTPEGAKANVTGFTLGGTATDNDGISRVVVTVFANGLEVYSGVIDVLSNNQWTTRIMGDWMTEGLTIDVEATAYDFALNQATSHKTLVLEPDDVPPVITVLSHQDNDAVNQTGFTVFGRISDELPISSFSVTVTDPLLGNTVNAVPVNIAGDGSWTLPIAGDQVSPNKQVTLSFTAADTNLNQASYTLVLNTVEVKENPVQLANRITFGVTPLMLAQIKAGTDILTQQLFDQNVDDSELEDELANNVPQTLTDLQRQFMYRMVKSKKQLREVMTWFWENHFNTSLNSHDNVAFEYKENNTFRRLALGRFEALLLASAKSPAMIYYLNNAENVKGAANENYAREIMELHSLGVDGGYTDDDVAALAKVFTGWHESNGDFFFNQAAHDDSDKQFLGQEIQGAGVSEGEQAIAILASHPATASYLCGKLITFFVKDEADSVLQSQCASTYLSADGDIASVLQFLFNTDTFAIEQVTRRKIKTPLELVIGVARSFGTTVSMNGLEGPLNAMDMRLFVYPVPTGYSERGEDWLNTNALLQRLKFVNQVIWQGSYGISVDVGQLLTNMSTATPEAIVSYLVDLAYAGEITTEEYNTFITILTENGGFDVNSNDASTKLQRLLGNMLSGPSYQMQ